MSLVTTIAVVAALLGAALIGGVFFAFSSFIMKALARLAPREGIAAMQSINVVVLNPAFLGAFLGTAVICLLVAVISVAGWGKPSAAFYLAGASVYFIGTFLVTGLGNVPLNNRLAAVDAADHVAVAVWEQYLKRWTRLNTVRTIAAMTAALLFAAGLVA